MDNKIRVLLNENQTNFLMAYKEQMMHIQKELKILKKKVAMVIWYLLSYKG